MAEAEADRAESLRKKIAPWRYKTGLGMFVVGSCDITSGRGHLRARRAVGDGLAEMSFRRSASRHALASADAKTNSLHKDCHF